MPKYTAQRRHDGSFVTNDGTYHVPNEGEWVEQWADLNKQWEADPSLFEQLPPPPEPVPPTLEEAKAAKLAEVNSACDAAMSTLTAGYPSTELLTFDKQETEARAYIVNSSTPTPLLSALASGRGIPLDVLVGKVIAKADAFSALSGSIIGQRQALEDQVDAATTIDELNSINVKFKDISEVATE